MAYYEVDRAEELSGLGVPPPRPMGGGVRTSSAAIAPRTAPPAPSTTLSAGSGGSAMPRPVPLARPSAVRTETPAALPMRPIPGGWRMPGAAGARGGGAGVASGGGGGSPRMPGAGGRAPFTPRGPARLPGAGGRVPPPAGARPAGARAPRPNVGRAHRPHGRPHRHPTRPWNRPWWQPWAPVWGYWPDWAPGWWTDWGVWITDVVPVDDVPYVVLWVDRCSPEYAAAVAAGTLQLPDYWEGYPVLVRYTCGSEVEEEPFAGVDLPAGSAKIVVGAAAGGLLGYVVGRTKGSLLGAALGGAAGWWLNYSLAT